MAKDFFAHKAGDYDTGANRHNNVDRIAEGIRAKVELRPDMEIMDFGSGTGLLLERIGPHVNKVVAVDVSPSMIAELAKKQDSLSCDIEMLELDLTRDTLARQFDGIISSMTMHHIADINAMFRRFHDLLKPGGFVAIADLDKEDGTFHEEDTGVHHHGFEAETLGSAADAAGFQEVSVDAVSSFAKEEREYPVLLLSAKRPL
jgi:2-polyprenyl-3-methyl-5-hydroxy-6-metoxy-1,4-benzoquinol methylase